MTKKNANIIIKTLLGKIDNVEIHTMDDAIKAADLIERLSKYTERKPRTEKQAITETDKGVNNAYTLARNNIPTPSGNQETQETETEETGDDDAEETGDDDAEETETDDGLFNDWSAETKEETIKEEETENIKEETEAMPETENTVEAKEPEAKEPEVKVAVRRVIPQTTEASPTLSEEEWEQREAEARERIKRLDNEIHKMKEAMYNELPPLPERNENEKVKLPPLPVAEPNIDLGNPDAFANFLPPLPERTDAEKKSLLPPEKREAPTDPLLEKLMAAAPGLMSAPAYQTLDSIYRRGESYEALCNTWDYFHRTQPGDWQQRPELTA